jgi:hypothetical protein
MAAAEWGSGKTPLEPSDHQWWPEPFQKLTNTKDMCKKCDKAEKDAQEKVDVKKVDPKKADPKKGTSSTKGRLVRRLVRRGHLVRRGRGLLGAWRIESVDRVEGLVYGVIFILRFFRRCRVGVIYDWAYGT